METRLERWGRFVARWPGGIIAPWMVRVFAALRFGLSLVRYCQHWLPLELDWMATLIKEGQQ